MDELQSIGVGIALGLVLVAILSLYPGEPFDYTTNSSDLCSVSPTTDDAETQRQQIDEIEHAAQRVKIQKLQEMLGLEKDKAQQLVQRAKQEALDAVAAKDQRSSSYRPGSSSAWLDRAFFTVMLGLVTWVLWQDYSINLLSVMAHLLPREAQVVGQVVDASRGFLAQVTTLWE